MVAVKRAISIDVKTTLFSKKMQIKMKKKSSKAKFENVKAEPHRARSYSAMSLFGNSYNIFALKIPENSKFSPNFGNGVFKI